MIFSALRARFFRKAVATSSASTPLEVQSHDRILVIAPHPDDESFGCGGLISLYAKQIDVLLLSRGEKGIPELSEKETKHVRMLEFQTAMALVGVNNFFIQDLNDLEIINGKEKLRRFDFSPYTKVFIPNSHDTHPDHLAAHILATHLVPKQAPRAEIFQYEIWSPFATVSHYLNIDTVIENKRELMANYKSQVSLMGYIESLVGLNRYRSLSGSGQYCEAYLKVKL